MTEASMDMGQILKYLPHRYPFLLLDKVTKFVAGERLQALKTSRSTSRSSRGIS